MSETIAKYNEILCDAISKLSIASATRADYDKTIVCKVEGRDSSNENHYWVNSGTMRFKAMVLDNDDTLYVEGTQVYILIPNGDYSQDKIIMGKYTSATSTDYLRNKNFDNLIISQTVELTETINLNLSKSNKTFYSEYVFSVTKMPTQKNFDYVGIEFNLNTLQMLNKEFSDGEGNYSISFQFINDKNENMLKEPIVISSNELIGNPKAMFEELNNQFLFKLTDNFSATHLSSIRLKFSGIPTTSEDNVVITLSNIKLHFGYDATTLPTNTLELILEEDENLKYTRGSSKAEEKQVYLTWYYQKDKSSPVLIYPQDKDNEEMSSLGIEVVWLKYKPGSQENDTGIMGTIHWQIPDDTELQIANVPITQPVILIQSFAAEERYKAYIKYQVDGETLYVESNELVFSAKDTDSYNFISGDPFDVSKSYTGVIIGNNAQEKMTNDTNTTYLQNSGIYSYVNGELCIQIDNTISRVGPWIIGGDRTLYSYPTGKDQNGNEQSGIGSGLMPNTAYHTNPAWYVGYDKNIEQKLRDEVIDGTSIGGIAKDYPTFPQNWVSNNIVKTMVALNGNIESNASLNLAYWEEATKLNGDPLNPSYLLSYNSQSNNSADRVIKYRGAELLNRDCIIVSKEPPTSGNFAGRIWVKPLS